MKDLHTENYKTLIKKLKKTLFKTCFVVLDIVSPRYCFMCNWQKVVFLLDGVFYICLLGPTRLSCCTSFLLLDFFLAVFLIIESGILMFPTIIIELFLTLTHSVLAFIFWIFDVWCIVIYNYHVFLVQWSFNYHIISFFYCSTIFDLMYILSNTRIATLLF